MELQEGPGPGTKPVSRRPISKFKLRAKGKRSHGLRKAEKAVAESEGEGASANANVEVSVVVLVRVVRVWLCRPHSGAACLRKCTVHPACLSVLRVLLFIFAFSQTSLSCVSYESCVSQTVPLVPCL